MGLLSLIQNISLKHDLQKSNDLQRSIRGFLENFNYRESVVSAFFARNPLEKQLAKNKIKLYNDTMTKLQNLLTQCRKNRYSLDPETLNEHHNQFKNILLESATQAMKYRMALRPKFKRREILNPTDDQLKKILPAGQSLTEKTKLEIKNAIKNQTLHIYEEFAEAFPPKTFEKKFLNALNFVALECIPERDKKSIRDTLYEPLYSKVEIICEGKLQEESILPTQNTKMRIN